jgi:hypothetical protein
MLPTKKILFPSSFWGIFDFFVLFVDFGKKNKKNITLQGRNEDRKHTSSRRKDKTDVLGNDTRKNPPRAKGVKTQTQTSY